MVTSLIFSREVMLCLSRHMSAKEELQKLREGKKLPKKLIGNSIQRIQELN